MTDLLADIKDADTIRATIGAEEYDAFQPARNKLDGIYDQVKADPALLTDAVLKALTDLAAASPFKDIHDPGAELHHRQTMSQDVCLTALRLIGRLPYAAPEKSQQLVDALEGLARDNLDFDIRKEAIMDLWMLAGHDRPHKIPAIEALERQGISNDCHYIRTMARDNLLSIAKEDDPAMLQRALAAQIQGAEDPVPEARTRALALLTNRIKSPECPYEEAESLMHLFEKAAARKGLEGEPLQYWAEHGIDDIQRKRLEDIVATGGKTRLDVQPMRPLQIKKPGQR
ncbi:MAG: hypothetical protein ACAH80_00200 [Alphaproteobacteria bacterium]